MGGKTKKIKSRINLGMMATSTLNEILWYEQITACLLYTSPVIHYFVNKYNVLIIDIKFILFDNPFKIKM